MHIEILIILLFTIFCFFNFCAVFFWRLFLLIERMVGSYMSFYSNSSRIARLEQLVNQLIALPSVSASSNSSSVIIIVSSTFSLFALLTLIFSSRAFPSTLKLVLIEHLHFYCFFLLYVQ